MLNAPHNKPFNVFASKQRWHRYAALRPQMPALGFPMLLRTLSLLIFFLLSNGAIASRELVLRSTSATYELVGGYTVNLVASSDGEKLMSVTLTSQNSTLTIPAGELSQVKTPVLSAVLVSGGSMGSKNIDVPHSITLGFGAYHCELNDCPSSITFVIKDLKYVESYVVHKEQLKN
ncbi:hypothetical protein [Arsukibacterium sp.]|uniref:hypothetical protein n=1 Tax=Arsukibacterium sp. TaxID=1977258 RepID=UPI001BD446AC|nr:hypothetical protein [Arsukibacterium sp.]